MYVSQTVILIYRLVHLMTCCDINMTESVNVRGIIGNQSINLSCYENRECKSKLRGEVRMTPQEGGKQNEPHNTFEEEEEQKNRIFESYLRARVL